jgi:succinate dehydrogenase (ubiquinone) membrane anchor subunit
MERLIALSLVPLCVTPFAVGSLNPVMDAVLCSLIVIHSHMGFQNVIIDYLPKKRMPKIRKGVMWSLNAATALVAVGLYEFETTDVGVTEAIARLWHA